MPFDCAPIEVVHATHAVITRRPDEPVKPDDGLNRENIRRVRDFIAGLPAKHFDMGFYEEPDSACGTVACIAGWACILSDSREEISRQDYSYRGRGAELFGLSPQAALELFELAGYSTSSRYWDATPAQAVAVLDNLIATGRVDWSVAEAVS